MTCEIYNLDCRDALDLFVEPKSVQICVTSPPYFGLRDYGVNGQLGLEKTPELYIEEMVSVFRSVRNVLRDDGTLWLNIGDSYASMQRSGTKESPGVGAIQSMPSVRNNVKWGKGSGTNFHRSLPTKEYGDVKQKDLIGIPWMLAFALRADGWYLRQDIIWAKPNPMPESVTDRCTKSHEYLFLLSKSAKYFIDPEGMKEPAIGAFAGNTKPTKAARAFADGATEHRTAAGLHEWADRQRSKADTFKRDDSKRQVAIPGQSVGTHRPDRDEFEYSLDTRNRRSVWTVATRPYKGAHFATFPPALIEPCILAGSRPGDLVLDPFMGSGTTAQVALQHGRRTIGCELNAEYLPLISQRTAQYV